MKIRSLAVLGSLIGAGLAVTPVATHAAATDAVTDLTATAVQKAGSSTTWAVTGSWTKNPDASAYNVYIADNADGTKSGDYPSKDTSAASFTLESDGLAEGATYWFVVASKAVNSTPEVAPFIVPDLDATAPKAAFSLNRRSTYLVADLSGTELVRRGSVVISQTSTSEPLASRQVIPGDGRGPIDWPLSRPSLAIVYSSAGVFAPRVKVSDRFGNVSETSLPTVSALIDTTKPQVRIAIPAKPGKVSSWRVIRGTAADRETGLMVAVAFVMQKRGDLWWAYDYKKRKWIKGYSTWKKTSNKSKANAATVSVKSNGTWSAPPIKGLRKGKIVVQALAADQEFNFKVTTVGPRTVR